MHTQTESGSPSGPTEPAVLLPAAAGLGLYLLTLSVEVLLGASLRWLLVFSGIRAVQPLIPLGADAGTIAWVAAIAPLLWSALAVCRPGRGGLWRRSIGARRPTTDELDALLLAAGSLGVSRLPTVWVLDQPLPEAGVRGAALVLSRTVVESDSLAAVLAHELGHLRSLDARLTEALDRLHIWGDPLAPPDDDHEADGPVLHAARQVVRLLGGGAGEVLLAPLWSAYWRSREYAADAFAASIGQAVDLAQHLADFELPLDFARGALPLDLSDHPPVALRIERLEESIGGAVSQ